MTPTIQGWGLSAAQIATLQGYKIDLGGAPLFVPNNALSAEEKQFAVLLNAAVYQFAEQQLLAAGPGAQIGFGDPFVIIPAIK